MAGEKAPEEIMCAYPVLVVASNTATANVLLPILADMSLTICQNPIYLVRKIFTRATNPKAFAAMNTDKRCQ